MIIRKSLTEERVKSPLRRRASQSIAANVPFADHVRPVAIIAQFVRKSYFV